MPISFVASGIFCTWKASAALHSCLAHDIQCSKGSNPRLLEKLRTTSSLEMPQRRSSKLPSYRHADRVLQAFHQNYSYAHIKDPEWSPTSREGWTPQGIRLHGSLSDRFKNHRGPPRIPSNSNSYDGRVRESIQRRWALFFVCDSSTHRTESGVFINEYSSRLLR